MSKFYVQSGNVSLVLSGIDSEDAARRTLQHTINNFFPIHDIEIRLLNGFSMDTVLMGLAELEPEVAVSQIGFGRDESGLFDRRELFAKLCGEAHSLSHLFDQLT